jgi:hypothetical protein
LEETAVMRGTAVIIAAKECPVRQKKYEVGTENANKECCYQDLLDYRASHHHEVYH